MSVSMYLVNPASDFATYFGGEVIGGCGLLPGAMVADLATTTLAALAPADFTLTICDENVSPVDPDVQADWIGITGKVSQRHRMFAIADHFRRRGRRVVIGGPYATLSPDHVRPHCDVLVRGEIENVSAQLFADLREGRARTEYVGDRPDLARSPAPQWDGYPNDRSVLGAVQTSRGCPFECEFCDVIQYLGRNQRHKPIPNVLAELDRLYAHGYRWILLADDNFTAHRRRAKELLEAIAWWRRTHPVDFITQVSIDAARDEELLDLCASAGLTHVFVGIETPNEESLREAKKRQNLHINLVEEVQRFVDHGIAVVGGMIVGFDADRLDVFERQFEFAMATPVPVFSLGALVAPEATPLYARIAGEGRLVVDRAEVQAVPWGSNIVPRNMTSQELASGLQRLSNALYAPEAFTERALRFIDTFGRANHTARDRVSDQAPLRGIDMDAVDVALRVRKLGPAEHRMWKTIWSATERRPATAPIVTRMLFQYAQARHMFSQGHYWDPQLGGPLPAVSAP
jgi:radical SAM superfamily enzyme YgiQ (UPF0313 family)